MRSRYLVPKSPEYGIFALKATSMKFKFFLQRAAKWLLVASLLNFGLAMAQTEPTLNQVYATAQSGNLDQAQVMMQQVLVSHPQSAKAHFVQSELFARQGNLSRAREALANAEKLAPGLPFAKAESVKALRAQLAAKSPPMSKNVSPVQYTSPVAPASSSSWGLPLLLACGVIVAGYFMFRRRKPEPFAQQPIYANQDGFNGPQSFGSGNAPYGQPAYANPGAMSGPQAFGMGNGAMQQPYGQPTGSGLGGRIMGGVATGLAVGAGVMAAEAIGRNLMGSHNPAPAAGAVNNLTNNDFQAIDPNPDMGGQNFGVNDTSSWDDGGSFDVGGGGDWDS